MNEALGDPIKGDEEAQAIIEEIREPFKKTPGGRFRFARRCM
jgi:hypothetical protein